MKRRERKLREETKPNEQGGFDADVSMAGAGRGEFALTSLGPLKHVQSLSLLPDAYETGERKVKSQHGILQSTVLRFDTCAHAAVV